ncbi:MAG: PAS domain S-box protein [Trueperaceae bacterium]|nr:PAS domain S-box protein [Trueperaceae bacterium]
MSSRTFSETSANHLLNALPLPVLLTDKEGKLSFANTAWLSLVRSLGYDQALLTASYAELCASLNILDEQDLARCTQAIAEILQGQRSGFQLDYQFRLMPELWFRMDMQAFEEGLLITHKDITEFKQAERQAELLLESPLDAMLLIDSEGLIQLVNKRLERLFGYSRDELFGQHLDILIPHRFRKQHRQHLQAYFANPKARPMGLTLDLFALAKDGLEHPVEISLNPIQVGNSTLVSAAIRDISQQKRIEAERNRLGRIIEESTNEVYLFDARTLRFIFSNESARRNLGYDEHELAHLTPLDIQLDYDLNRFEDLVTPLRTGKKRALQFSTTYQRKDGSSYPADINLQLFADENPPLFAAIVVDTSERQRSEEALRESRERMAMHLEHTPLAAIEWRIEDGLITAWNPAAERLFGYTAEEVVLQASADIIIPADLRNQLKPLLTGKIGPEGLRSAHRNSAKDGSVLLCEWYNTAITNLYGEIVGVAALGLDITSRQRALESLLSAQEEERARISRDLHDQVGQSLTGLGLGLTNAMASDTEPNLQQFKQQTDEILADVRRISRDLRPALLDELGLEPALNRLVRDLRERSSLQLETLIRLPEVMPKDQQTVIYRVVQEALTNISRHARANHASVTLITQNNQIQLVIEDDGQGFELDNVVSSEHVGLAGMRERIELAGGKLLIESSPGKGTTISARFMCRS